MEIYEEKDKFYAPFLLAASFQGFIKFQGRVNNSGVLSWKFSPSDKAKKLLTQFNTKTEPRIPASDLFTAISTWWQEIAEMKQLKNGGIKHGY